MSSNNVGNISSLCLCYTISYTLYKAMTMNIHYKYSDIELASPACLCNRGTYYEHPIERTNTDTVIKLDFRFDLDQDEPSGILMYNVQGKRKTRFNYSSSINTIYTKTIEEVLKMTRLLITWKMKHSESPEVNAMLVEYDNKFVLNEDTLAQLYDKVNEIPATHIHSGGPWLMYDNIALRVMSKVVQKTDLELSITVFKTLEDTHTEGRTWIEPLAYTHANRRIWIEPQR